MTSADVFTWAQCSNGLSGWTLRLEYEDNSENFPELCSIDSSNRDSLVICDVNDIGKPLANSLYHVPWERVRSITVV